MHDEPYEPLAFLSDPEIATPSPKPDRSGRSPSRLRRLALIGAFVLFDVALLGIVLSRSGLLPVPGGGDRPPEAAGRPVADRPPDSSPREPGRPVNDPEVVRKPTPPPRPEPGHTLAAVDNEEARATADEVASPATAESEPARDPIETAEPAPAVAPDPIQAGLDRAKEAYRRKRDEIKASALAALKTREAKARREGNKGLVDKIIEKQQALEATEEPGLATYPTEVRQASLRKLADARTALGQSYGRAVADYIKQGRDAEAEAVQQELNRFRAESPLPTRTRNPMPNAPAAAPAQVVRLFPPLPPDTRWDFTRIHSTQGRQSGAFRIMDNVIYHLDADTPVGEAWQDEQGVLYLVFRSHRKLVGPARLGKVRDGLWRGDLEMADGQIWQLDIMRR